MKKFLAILALAFLGPAASAQIALGTANNFNVFVFGTGSVNAGEAEGAVAVGSNFTLTGYNTTIKGNLATINNLPIPNLNSATKTGSVIDVSLYVGGNLTVSNSPNVNYGGSAYIGGTYNGGLNLNSYGSTTGHVYSGSNYPSGFNYTVAQNVFTTQQSNLDALSASLHSNANAKAGIVNTSDNNNWYIDASKQSGSIKYFQIDASVLSSANGTNLNVQNLKDTDTLVIDVTGKTVTSTSFSLVNVNHNSYYSNILWNFASTDSTSAFDISGRAFEGSLLAPYANVDQNQLFEGNLIANTWTDHGFEDHFGTNNKFTGNLTLDTPEPGASALMASMGLTGLGFIMRRYRKRV